MSNIIRNFASLILQNKSVHRFHFLENSLVLKFHTSSTRCRKRGERKPLNFNPKPKSEVLNVWRGITVQELAGVYNNNVKYIQELFLGMIHGRNTPIDDIKLLQDAIRRSGKRMRLIGKPLAIQEECASDDILPLPPADPALLKPRPPVVTVMGHVDHGKTTLLDALQHSRIVDGEFGGITQHIGAFSVEMPENRRITFLDTPGHAAFSCMRQRGANITDLVVLVVAANDGVKEQTVESIRMAREAKTPILVAINKIDMPNADVDRAKFGLVEHGIQVESLGGDVQAVPISALHRRNLDNLSEALLLQAEILNLGADYSGPVEAVVVESKVDRHRGKLCTVIVQRGTLKLGTVLISGTCLARVRAMRSATGQTLSSVTPGNPVEIEGWRDLPSAGDCILEAPNEKAARLAIKYREDVARKERQQEDAPVIAAKEEQHLREYQERLQEKRAKGYVKYRQKGPRKNEIEKDDGTPTLHVVVKSDVDGTLEAILNALDTYELSESAKQCRLDIVHYGVGDVSESDIELAETFNAVVYAFNIKSIENVTRESKADIRHFTIIYDLVDDVKLEIVARLPAMEVDEIVGEATVLQQFEISDSRKKVYVAGCRCVKGNLKRSAKYRLIRNGEQIFEGNLLSMRHLKEEVDTIKKDMECGLQFNSKETQFQMGDTLQCYLRKNRQQQLTWDPGF